MSIQQFKPNFFGKKTDERERYFHPFSWVIHPTFDSSQRMRMSNHWSTLIIRAYSIPWKRLEHLKTWKSDYEVNIIELSSWKHFSASFGGLKQVIAILYLLNTVTSRAGTLHGIKPWQTSKVDWTWNSRQEWSFRGSVCPYAPKLDIPYPCLGLKDGSSTFRVRFLESSGQNSWRILAIQMMLRFWVQTPIWTIRNSVH